MAAEKLQKEVFRRGSKTYYNSTIFFPTRIRLDVSTLYAFVRTADNFVDTIPQQPEALGNYIACYRRELSGENCSHPLVGPFVAMMRRLQFDPLWIEAFFESMALDLTKRIYRTMAETLHYVYGSAEVIGLCMAQIMGVPAEASEAARMLGRAMQYINFVRDIAEDNRLGRIYLPLEETTLKTLEEHECRQSPESMAEFRRYIHRQIGYYQEWHSMAVSGYRFIPADCLAPIKTAAKMYDWTARMIARNPLVVFRRKIKPTRMRIICSMLMNMLLHEKRR